jgi:hypothetical protein
MMAKMHGAMKHSGQNTKGAPNDKRSCCDIQSSQPTPVTESQAVTPVVLAQPSASVVAVAETPRTTVALVAEADPAPPPPDTQARLCTFQN